MKKFLFIALLLGSGFYGFAQTFSLIADSVRKYRSIPGLVYAVFTPDHIIDSGTTGVRVFRSRENIRFADYFYIGSNTTAVTAGIATKIVESGKIQWNSTIIGVIPELNGKISKFYHRVTLQQLLTQRGGIPEYPADSDYHKLAFQLTGKNTAEQRRNFVIMALKRQPLLILDSSLATYSVAGTVVAAAMLEKATGRSWEDLVEQYINKPLNIRAATSSTGIHDSLLPAGHAYNAGSLVIETRNPPERMIAALAPAGNLNISAHDYIVYLQDLLKTFQTQKAAAEKMLFGFNGYAMGWENERWKNFHTSHAFGKDPFFSCYAEIIKEKNIGILVLCNSGPPNGRSVVLNFARLLRDYYTR